MKKEQATKVLGEAAIVAVATALYTVVYFATTVTVVAVANKIGSVIASKMAKRRQAANNNNPAS